MKDKVKVIIEGLNLNKLLNEFLVNGVIIEQLQIKPRKIAFFVKTQYIPNIEIICKKYHKYYKIIQNNILFNFLNCFPKYFGFIMAMILCFCYLFSFNIFISKINLKYKFDRNYNTGKVESFLSNNNINSGMLKADVSCQEIEKMIVSNFDDISACSVKLNGGVLEIIVYPSVVVNEQSDENIYSKYNAVITSVNVFSGRAKVKVGDVVRVGDVLIENHNGASGEIFGKVVFEDYIIYNEKQVIENKTGNVSEYYTVSLLGVDFIKTQNHNNYTLKSVEKFEYFITKNLFVPFYFNKYFVYEMELVNVVVPFETQEQHLKEELKNKIISKIENTDSIKNVSYSVVSEDNMTRLDCFVECEFNLV